VVHHNTQEKGDWAISVGTPKEKTMNVKINACIFTLSSRTKCLKLCLESLYKYYNNKFNYPVYVYYFDDIYSEDQIGDIHKTIGTNIHFHQLDYGIPYHIEEDQLFPNRQNKYARTFSKNRMGYLHVSSFFVNSYYYPGTHLNKYDYCFHFDDETLFTKDVTEDFFQTLRNKNRLIGSLNTSYYPETGAKQRVLDTTENLFEFCNYYIEKYTIQKQETRAFKALLNKDNFYKDYFLVTDSQVYDTKFFQQYEWMRWITEINIHGGIYAHRWGDHELNGLFHAIHSDEEYLSICNINRNDVGAPVPNSLGIECSALRHIQSIAPGVKNNDRRFSKDQSNFLFHDKTK